jgi:excisionase family DNA binding protein
MKAQEQLLVPIGRTKNDGARCALGNISRPTIYGLVHSGQIDLVKIGSRSYITAASIEAFVQRRAAARRGAA